ncbi:taste receptor type 1 member 1-like [Alosa pseudoharengus]|uniref:taste receptor type 1 member 1-like n=1 Tax=Alosa pseudoharengus TaxID=34774 RepID=UPI003F8ADFA7
MWKPFWRKMMGFSISCQNIIGLSYIKEHLPEHDEGLRSPDTTSTSSDEDDFFSNVKQTHSHEISKQLDGYLAATAEGVNTLAPYPAAPELRCSSECRIGHRRVKKSFHSCCFECEICIAGTYINHTADPNTCQKCQEHEWSANGSTSCQNRTVVFLRHDAAVSIVLMLAASSTILLCGCVLALFVYHYDTPVVKSAGGKMSLLVLVFLALSTVSIFFFGGRPSPTTCSLRIPKFLVFYTATLSCLAVRSFQIVFVFKLAAKLPKAYEFWVKHGGQWLVVAICTIAQVLLSISWMSDNAGPQPSQIQHFRETVLICTLGNINILFAMFTLGSLLSLASFAFAYMGTDLPKNYNEGKAVTFSLLIFYISWALFLTLYFALEDNHVDITVANAFCILLSIWGVLFGYFGPKCYIILFQPERNTATYFQAAIQIYNLQMR